MNIINSPGYLPKLTKGFEWDYGFDKEYPGFIYIKITQFIPFEGTYAWVRRDLMSGYDRAETRKRLISTAQEMADEWAPWNPAFHEEITLGVFDNIEAPEDERK